MLEPTANVANQQVLAELVARTKQITVAEGTTQTIIPFLAICRYSYQASLQRSVLTPSFCLILQGTKQFHLGQDIIDYHPGDYLAAVIDIPASGQVVGATKETPYIGLRVDFTTQEIISVAMEAKIDVKPKANKLQTGALIGKADADLFDIFIRLLKLIDKPQTVPFLASLLKREMIFNLLTGDYGHFFLQPVLYDQQAEGVGKAIGWIKENTFRSFTVGELAKSVNMSVSGLHHKFKTITTMGPLQYQKQLRLQEARRLLLSGAMDVTTAALEVGYESPSQFNREYRRLFGLPPLQDIKAKRNRPAAGVS